MRKALGDGEFGNHQEEQFSNALSVNIVKKKDSPTHICIDFWQFNKLTVFDPYPTTPAADIFHGMKKDKYLSKIDLRRVTGRYLSVKKIS
ncbi:transposon ty3-g Gag-Pol polyprotein [Plakobranchus ocellatus]|uniref:Transposon ty3-g Gag-Pol polyprotein n=1 Tax=Plakobranchus ocellatus TaxID=259542 RepID=A0AAV4DSJ5_9GAST|nr:transposon ty3-g Gag-Pol polyprotein [Plakobranchus ocellatus]